MRGDQRRLNFYDISTKTNKSGLPISPSIIDVIRGLRHAHSKGIARLEIDRKTKVLSIVDIQDIGSNTIIYLMNADKSAPDVRFSNEITGSSRMGNKTDQESRDFGAHLVISHSPNLPGRFLCVLEKNTGLSRDLARRLIQATLKNLYKTEPQFYTAPDPSGARDNNNNPKKINYRPMIEFLGYPSDTFIQQLNTGKLLEVQLIHSEKNQPLGGTPWLEKEESILRLKPDRAKIKNVTGVWNGVKVALNQYSSNYENARIRFHSTVTNKDETVMVSALNGALLDDRFVKSRLITGINPRLPECLEGISTPFAQKIIQLM